MARLDLVSNRLSELEEVADKHGEILETSEQKIAELEKDLLLLKIRRAEKERLVLDPAEENYEYGGQGEEYHEGREWTDQEWQDYYAQEDLEEHHVPTEEKTSQGKSRVTQRGLEEEKEVLFA